MNERVPQPELARRSPSSANAPQREEVDRQVPEVEARAGEGPRRKGRKATSATASREPRPSRAARGQRRLSRSSAPGARERRRRASRGGTSAVTTLPAATNDCSPTRIPGRSDTSPQERAPLDHHRRRHRGEVRLQGMVVVAHVRVGEDQHALGQGHLALEADPFGEVQEALVAHEALLADIEAGEPAPVEVEEAHVVEDRPAADPGAQQAQPGGAQLRHEQQPIGDHGQREEAEADARAQPISSSAFTGPRTAARRGSARSCRKYRRESRTPLTVEVLSSRRM